jgi:hypothetical protein
MVTISNMKHNKGPHIMVCNDDDLLTSQSYASSMKGEDSRRIASYWPLFCIHHIRPIVKT